MNPKSFHPVTAGAGAVTLGIALLATACSGGQPTATSGAQHTGGATVSVRTLHGAGVLVDTAGKALYTNNQDRSAHPRCTTSDCTSIWKPLTVQGGAGPTATDTVSGKVASVALADGSRQVTWKGMPLYTFSLDHDPSKVTGNGVHDSFGGTRFVWHAAVAKGQMPLHSSGGSGGSSGSGGSGSGSSGSGY